MAIETKQTQTSGKVGEVSTSPRESTIKTALKSAGRVFASALLVSSIMLASPKAMAEEAKAPQKAGIGVKVGAGYDEKSETPRAIATVEGSVPLPLSASLSGAMGVSSTTKGPAKLEETKLDLGIPIYGPLFIDLYGYSSQHMGVPTVATGADVGVGLPRGAILAGYEHLFDFGTDVVFLAGKAEVVPGLLWLKASGGWICTTETGSVGAGFILKPASWSPELGVHAFSILTKDQLLFMDTVATLGWSF